MSKLNQSVVFGSDEAMSIRQKDKEMGENVSLMALAIFDDKKPGLIRKLREALHEIEKANQIVDMFCSEYSRFVRFLELSSFPSEFGTDELDTWLKMTRREQANLLIDARDFVEQVERDRENQYDRLPPQNREADEAVLGLTPPMFY